MIQNDTFKHLTLQELLKLSPINENIQKEMNYRLLEIDAQNVKAEIMEAGLNPIEISYVSDFIENIQAINTGKASWNKSFLFNR